ncbi:2Fe-2S iron-sulfur cluster-binding protein, partial [Brucella rhizosphaerae]
SFKYHRPRGILTAGSAEPNALMTIGRGGRTEPNTRATMQELYDGLEASSQNRWPSLDFDIGAFNSLLSPFLSAGFYYKTFMWPAALWEKLYEPFIRRAAGLGRASYEADPDGYEKAWIHCDLLVVGAGAAGLASALAAGRAGARVILVDEHSRCGGGLLSETVRIGDESATEFVATALAELASLSNVTVMPRTTVFGWYDGNVFGAVERVQKHVQAPLERLPVERLWRIVAREALLATGAEERPLVFGGNDIPGVMMAGAMRSYLNRYAVAPGRKVAIFTTNDSGYALARDLEAVGASDVVIIDSRAEGAGFRYAGTAKIIKGAVVSDAHGGKSLSSISVTIAGRTQKLAVDALAMSGGFNPVISLACHRGGRPEWNASSSVFLAPSNLKGLTLAGAAANIDGLGACLQHGFAKGAERAEALGYSAKRTTVPAVADDPSAVAKPLWSIPGVRGKAFVDYQNDVHRKDLGLAVREGYGHVELAKRYTTNGMATDQGKLSNVNAIALLAQARGVS